MKGILENIEDSYSKQESILFNLQFKLTENEQDQEYILKMITNPAEISLNLLSKYMDEEEINHVTWNQAITLSKFFTTQENAPQIIRIKKYLSELQDNILQKLCNIQEEIKRTMKSTQEEMQSLKEKKSFLESITQDVYVDEEMMMKLDSILASYSMNESIVDFYMNIAKNNVRIAKERTRKKSIVDESAQEVDDFASLILKEREEEQREDAHELEQLKKDLLIHYRSFINNEKYQKQDPEVFNRVLQMIEYVPKYMENCGDLNTFMNISEDGVQSLIMCTSVEELSMLSFLLIKQAYQENNLEEVKDIERHYKTNPYSFYQWCSQEIKDLNETVKSRLQNCDLGEIKKIIEACASMDEETAISYFKSSGMRKEQIDLYKIYSHQIKIEQILKKELDEESVQKLKEEYQAIKDVIHPPKIAIPPLRENESPYDNAFANYIVFVDSKQAEYDLAEIISNYREANISDEFSIMNYLMQNSLANLHSKFKAIKTGSKSNLHDIREAKSGSMRIGYKVLEGAKVNGHNVIMLFRISYGGVDNNRKNDFLQLNVKMYEKLEETTIQKMRKIFAEENNQDHINEEAKSMIDETLEQYKAIQALTLQNKLS